MRLGHTPRWQAGAIPIPVVGNRSHCNPSAAIRIEGLALTDTDIFHMTRTPRLQLLSLSLSFALLHATPVLAQQGVDKVNGNITASAGQTWGDLETVNGSIRIDSGTRIGSAETVNGSIHAGDNVTSKGLETVNGAITAGQRLDASGDVETVNGAITLGKGSRAHSVSTVSGAIELIDTDLSGGIETVAGDITVGAGSHVRGGLKVEKPKGRQSRPQDPPRIVIGANAVVDGPLVFEREVKLYVHRSAKIGPVTGATAHSYDGAAPNN